MGSKRAGLMGCGAMGQFIVDFFLKGMIFDCSSMVVYLRAPESKGRLYLEEKGIPWVCNFEELLQYHPEVIIEAASHDVVEIFGPEILKQGIDFIPMSLGAFVDHDLLEKMTLCAKSGGSRLYIPSGGIGALDALQAAVLNGVNTVTMTTRKNSIA